MSEWTYRQDTRQGDKAHGITFHMWERAGDQVRGEWSGQGVKSLVDGRCSLTLATNQYRYGHELIAQIYTRNDPIVTCRQADGWTRIQAYMGYPDLGTANTLDQIAHQIRRLNA